MKNARKPAVVPRKLDFETPTKRPRTTTAAAAASTNQDESDIATTAAITSSCGEEESTPSTPGSSVVIAKDSLHIVTPSTKSTNNNDDNTVVVAGEGATKPPAARRRLAFGRSETIDICDNVRLTYKLIRKTTGAIGGNGSFGAIYGELTVGSMQKVINLMKEHCEFGPTSRFIDVGSGIGKPNLHVIQDPGVEFSYGIEMERSRWLLGLACLNSVLKESSGADSTLGYACMFDHGNIKAAKTFDPFTHIYMFSIGFPPSLWEHLADMFNASQSPFLICFHSPRVIIETYEFEVELITQTCTSMHGSSEGHSGYLYRRIGAVASSRSGRVPCDAVYRDAYDLVKSGIDQLGKAVSQQVDHELGGGRVTRRTKVIHCVESDDEAHN